MEGLCNKEEIAKYLKIEVEEVDSLILERMPYIELPGIEKPIKFDLTLIDSWLKKRVRRKKYPKRPSTNEANFLILMANKGVFLEFEPKKFKLKDTTYLPDFYCKKADVWYEVSSTESNKWD